MLEWRMTQRANVMHIYEEIGENCITGSAPKDFVPSESQTAGKS